MHHRKLGVQTFIKFLSFFMVLGVIYSLISSDVSRSTMLEQVRPIRPAIVRQSPASPHTCRALFTITHDVHHHLLQTSEHNGTHSEDVRGDEWVVDDSAGGKVGDREWWSAAAKIVQQLVQKRSFLSGAPTSYYYSLAALLPKLLSFGDDSHDGEKRDEANGTIQIKDYSGLDPAITMKQTNSPFFRERSRVMALGGVLPYVPCVIALYQQPTAFTKCVRTRLEKKPQLWLSFMGDSKIRGLFTDFINRTDSEYNYSISYQNMTVSWPTLRQKLMKREVRWCDMEASTSVARGLRISFSFKKLNQIELSEFNEEIADLWRWASGEPSPDLLVVGYTSWIIGARNLYLNKAYVYTGDILDLLMEKHSVIVPLLEQISHRSRVLVLPQSRLRPHSEVWVTLLGALSDAIFDWSEMTFLHLLKQYREGRGDGENHMHNSSHVSHSAPPPRHFLAIDKASRGEPRLYRTLERDWTLQDHPSTDETRRQTTMLQDQRSPDVTDANLRPKTTVQTSTQQEATNQPMTTRDDLRTGRARIAEDSSKPQGIRETFETTTEDLKPQGTTEQNKAPNTDRRTRRPAEEIGTPHDIPTPHGTTERTLTFLDHLIPTRSSSGVWWWDSSLPLNLAGILECNELYNRGLAYHRIYREAVLHCLDVQHAGRATNNDLVTMLLNLLCNSVSGLHHTYCCT
ncbi:uncharacterized protein [Panulirus ornatus]|uniref:uncharacterized protein n=1 Tax=Panulirus ornatus TaxID=150431 RepID=UPI003A84E45F